MRRPRGAGYEKLQTDDDSNPAPSHTQPISSKPKPSSQYRRDDARFESLKSDIPWASIVLAVCLTLFGIFSFVLAWLHFTQAILGKEQAEIGFTFLGLVTFTPGFYHCFLAYGAWRGFRGYSFDSIPAF